MPDKSFEQALLNHPEVDLVTFTMRWQNYVWNCSLSQIEPSIWSAMLINGCGLHHLPPEVPALLLSSALFPHHHYKRFLRLYFLNTYEVTMAPFTRCYFKWQFYYGLPKTFQVSTCIQRYSEWRSDEQNHLQEVVLSARFAILKACKKIVSFVNVHALMITFTSGLYCKQLHKGEARRCSALPGIIIKLQTTGESTIAQQRIFTCSHLACWWSQVVVVQVQLPT